MLATIDHKGETFRVDLQKAIDISIAVSTNGVQAWYVDVPKIKPVINQHFTGSVKLGGAVNFCDISFNPHGHGTHTESVGHITPDDIFINEALREYFFIAHLISVVPQTVDIDDQWQKKGDLVITKEMIENVIGDERPEALIIRTLPNDAGKKTRNYSNTNFCYLHEEALRWLAEVGIMHLLVDLPSVDRESDGGLLKAHRAFWAYPEGTRINSTITEFVFIPDEVRDGRFFLNLQVSSFENDAVPSRPLLFELIK